MPNYSNPPNNQYQSGWNGISYDANGNLTNDTFHTYQWNAGGHPVVVGPSGPFNLTYDAWGYLVEENVPASSYTDQRIRDTDGALLAISQTQAAAAAYITLPGGASAVYVGEHYRITVPQIGWVTLVSNLLQPKPCSET